MIQNCPNCKKKLRYNWDKSRELNLQVYECPKQFGGCGYSNIKAAGKQTNLTPYAGFKTFKVKAPLNNMKERERQG